MGEDFTFMHGNVPIHSGYIIRNWVKEKEYTVMKWPTYSPDLNPIEHIWVALKDSMHKAHPNLPTVSGGALKVKEAIGKALIECWDALGDEVFDRLIESMPRRVAAVIKAEGWYTKYLNFSQI